MCLKLYTLSASFSTVLDPKEKKENNKRRPLLTLNKNSWFLS